MEAIKVQDVAVRDLPWIIEHDPAKCTLCGSCVAGCTFKAIKPAVISRSVTVSEAGQPKPVHKAETITVIKQVASLTDFCRGCGMCERVCPNGAIRPVQNPAPARISFQGISAPSSGAAGQTSMPCTHWIKSSSAAYPR